MLSFMVMGVAIFDRVAWGLKKGLIFFEIQKSANLNRFSKPITDNAETLYAIILETANPNNLVIWSY